jgi:hypothetical protein
MQTKLAALLMMVCAAGAAEEFQKPSDAPPTIAFLTAWHTSPTSDDEGPLRVVMTPLATYKGGRWLSGGAYDGSETRGFSEPAPSAEERERFWADLVPQRFYGVYDPALEFTPTALGEYEAAGGTRVGLDGILVSATPRSDSPFLVMNRKGPFPATVSVEEVARRRGILKRVKVGLREAEKELLTKRYKRDFDPALAQHPVLKEAFRFRLNERTDAIWVHFTVTYADEKMKAERSGEDVWKGDYYGVFKADGSRHPLWQHATIDSIGNIGTFYEFLGAADVNGDGVSELILEEYYYELQVYFLYELKDGQFVKVAGAGEDGP